MDKQYRLTDAPDDSISALAFGPAEGGRSLLAVSSWDSTVRVLDPVANALVYKDTCDAPVLDVAFLGSTSVISGGLDRTVRLHHVEGAGAAPTAVLGKHDAGVKSVVHATGRNLVFSGSWDRTVKAWDPRAPATAGGGAQPVAIIRVPDRVYSMCPAGPESDVLIVATAGRHILVYDVRKVAAAAPDALMSTRESLLKHQTRVVRAFPDGSGFVVGSIEGRVAVDFVDATGPGAAAKFAFKCHRKKAAGGGGGEEEAAPVHAIAFHPKYGTFATGGGDRSVAVWDWQAKKRLTQFTDFPASVAALSFSPDGALLAIASSDYTEPEAGAQRPAGVDSVYIRHIADSDVRSKARMGM